jgi:hypothetical protein
MELCDGSLAEGARSPAEGAEAEPEVAFLLSPGEEVGGADVLFWFLPWPRVIGLDGPKRAMLA